MNWKLLVQGALVVLFIWWVGADNVREWGANIGSGITQVSRQLDQNQPLQPTGPIVLDGIFGKRELVALGQEWRRLVLRPGAELCTDPWHKVEQSSDSTDAQKFFRSATGQTEHIHFYLLRYGEDCRFN
jgi:hypothetical protein